MAKYLTVLLCLLVPVFLFAQQNESAYIHVLGVAQDGGYPHTGCQKPCCVNSWKHENMRRNVVSLALVDPASGKWWLFEATPDFKEQLHHFQEVTGGRYPFLPAGIFITHAHIGHYTGLMDLGREVMNAQLVPVYVLPKMANFLQTNGPWSQLVNYKNIDIRPLTADSAIQIATGINVTAATVPHRDEYSETAGFTIVTPVKKYLFIPDINKWEKWNRDIIKEVSKVDIALLDATFYKENEIPGMKFTSVPHPFVTETMKTFSSQPEIVKSKIHFIHFNHTNPLLSDIKEQKKVLQQGFNIANEDEQL